MHFVSDVLQVFAKRSEAKWAIRVQLEGDKYQPGKMKSCSATLANILFGINKVISYP